MPLIECCLSFLLVKESSPSSYASLCGVVSQSHGRIFFPKIGVSGENQRISRYLAKYGNCKWSVLTCLPSTNFNKGFFLLHEKDVVERRRPACQTCSGGSRPDGRQFQLVLLSQCEKIPLLQEALCLNFLNCIRAFFI